MHRRHHRQHEADTSWCTHHVDGTIIRIFSRNTHYLGSVSGQRSTCDNADDIIPVDACSVAVSPLFFLKTPSNMLLGSCFRYVLLNSKRMLYLCTCIKFILLHIVSLDLSSSVPSVQST